ncbi:dihydrodipicolinate synthase family protein [Actinacidiphila sp. bgisy167]|uniref:dihydrodipicolinate synthase family protein n=1 Tax=Actinacidiphila sp. bgisy167 TaxID=3413797 RepID=UPI003D750398
MGIHVPLITPFDAVGRVAADALERLAHDMADEGVAGLVALGTTAEAATLDEAEKEVVRATVGRVCRERGLRFTVGAGGPDTRRTAAELAELDADAALVSVPSYVRPSQAGVVAHFEALAAASAVPLVVYNIPYRTGLALTADTVRALAAIEGVAGFKHAVGGIDQDTVLLVGQVPLYAGDDVFAPALLALGAEGAITASAHLATERWVELARRHDARQARALARLAAACFAEPNRTVIKAVLHARGRIPTPDVRLPLLPAGQPSLGAALRALAASGDTRDRTHALIGETG